MSITLVMTVAKIMMMNCIWTTCAKIVMTLRKEMNYWFVIGALLMLRTINAIQRSREECLLITALGIAMSAEYLQIAGILKNPTIETFRLKNLKLAYSNELKAIPKISVTLLLHDFIFWYFSILLKITSSNKTNLKW